MSDAEHQSLLALFEAGESNERIAYELQRCKRTIRRRRVIYDERGTTRAPSTKPRGRPRHVTDEIMDTLKAHALINPYIDREETKKFVKDRFGKRISFSTVSRAWLREGYRMKKTRRVAQQRDATLRRYFLKKLLKYKSY